MKTLLKIVTFSGLLVPRWLSHRWPFLSASPRNRWLPRSSWQRSWKQRQTCPLCTVPTGQSASGTQCRSARYSCASPAGHCCSGTAPLLARWNRGQKKDPSLEGDTIFIKKKTHTTNPLWRFLRYILSVWLHERNAVPFSSSSYAQYWLWQILVNKPHRTDCSWTVCKSVPKG